MTQNSPIAMNPIHVEMSNTPTTFEMSNMSYHHEYKEAVPCTTFSLYETVQYLQDNILEKYDNKLRMVDYYGYFASDIANVFLIRKERAFGTIVCFMEGKIETKYSLEKPKIIPVIDNPDQTKPSPSAFACLWSKVKATLSFILFAIILLCIPAYSIVKDVFIMVVVKAKEFKYFCCSSNFRSARGDFFRYCNRVKNNNFNLLTIYLWFNKYKHSLLNLELYVIVTLGSFLQKPNWTYSLLNIIATILVACSIVVACLDYFVKIANQRQDIEAFLRTYDVDEEIVDNEFTYGLSVEEQLIDIFDGNLMIYSCKKSDTKIIFMPKSNDKRSEFVINELLNEGFLHDNQNAIVFLVENDSAGHKRVGKIKVRSLGLNFLSRMFKTPEEHLEWHMLATGRKCKPVHVNQFEAFKVKYVSKLDGIDRVIKTLTKVLISNRSFYWLTLVILLFSLVSILLGNLINKSIFIFIPSVLSLIIFVYVSRDNDIQLYDCKLLVKRPDEKVDAFNILSNVYIRVVETKFGFYQFAHDRFVRGKSYSSENLDYPYDEVIACYDEFQHVFNKFYYQLDYNPFYYGLRYYDFVSLFAKICKHLNENLYITLEGDVDTKKDQNRLQLDLGSDPDKSCELFVRKEQANAGILSYAKTPFTNDINIDTFLSTKYENSSKKYKIFIR